VSIMQRDVALMELLVERRAETLDEVAARFFPAQSRKRARNRLGQLTGAGYLQRTKVMVPSFGEPQNVYTLGPKGNRALELRSPAAVELFGDRRFNPTLRTASLPHQIVTNRVADRLGVRMTPEHLLARARDAVVVRPDGVYRAGERPDIRPDVWVEVDLGHYSRRRLHAKAEAAMQQDETVRGMVFVCATAERARQIERWLGEPGYGGDRRGEVGPDHRRRRQTAAS
jgi:hypothetical protein